MDCVFVGADFVVILSAVPVADIWLLVRDLFRRVSQYPVKLFESVQLCRLVLFEWPAPATVGDA